MPSEFRRTRSVRLKPLTPLKKPPTMILPSFWTNSDLTSGFVPPNVGLKAVSRVPSLLRRRPVLAADSTH